jgi:hypothetical protein
VHVRRLEKTSFFSAETDLRLPMQVGMEDLLIFLVAVVPLEIYYVDLRSDEMTR